MIIFSMLFDTINGTCISVSKIQLPGEKWGANISKISMTEAGTDWGKSGFIIFITRFLYKILVEIDKMW